MRGTYAWPPTSPAIYSRRQRITVSCATPNRAATARTVNPRVASIASVIDPNPAARAFRSIFARIPARVAGALRNAACRRDSVSAGPCARRHAEILARDSSAISGVSGGRWCWAR